MDITTMNDAVVLCQTLRLASPALPIGAYSYSQGFETAVAKGWVVDESTARDWIEGLLRLAIARLDLPLLVRLRRALATHDHARLVYWSHYLRASREARELADEDRMLGAGLLRLLGDDSWAQQACAADVPPSLPLGFAAAGLAWGLPEQAALTAYAWSWLENQVAAAMKTIPLGQSAGQRLLRAMLEPLARAVTCAAGVADDDLGALAPGFAIACAHHETQYTRIFRS